MSINVTTQPASIGRVVHYVLANGQHRAATVINTFVDNRPNLAITLDVTNDLKLDVYHDDSGVFPDDSLPFVRIGGIAQVDSVPQDEGEKAPGTWHWPERV